MFCANCGRELREGVKFCENCGAPADPAVPAASAAGAASPAAGRWVSRNIALCPDGKYRWVHEVSLFRNPMFFVMVWKIFFFILLGIFAFTALMDLISWGFSAEDLLNTLKMFGYFLGGMTVLTGLGYLLYAAMMGGKYCVLFEMDERGVNHRQMPKQAKKAQLIGALTVLAGLAAGRPSVAGAGLASARTEMYSEFARVRRVRVNRRARVIRVNGLLDRNQVYAEAEDFDRVLSYILQRVPEKARPKK